MVDIIKKSDTFAEVEEIAYCSIDIIACDMLRNKSVNIASYSFFESLLVIAAFIKDFLENNS